MSKNQLRLLTGQPGHPDLNCKEHSWDIVYRQVSASANPPRSVQELEIAVVQAWTNVPKQQTRTLVQSMPNLCRECLDSRGGHTNCALEAFASTVMDSSTFCKSAKNAIIRISRDFWNNRKVTFLK